MVTCEGEESVLMTQGLHSRQAILLFGMLLSVFLGATACRDHSLTSDESQKTSYPNAQQSAQLEIGSPQEKPCREFVQGFYDWYFDRLNHVAKVSTNGPTFADVVRLSPEVVSPRLRQMLEEDLAASSRNQDQIVGLDFDPYINAQDWEGKYHVEKVAVRNNTCTAALWGTDSGVKREIVDAELELAKNRWVFVNFHYPGGANPREENLIELLTLLRDERNITKKERRP
jgi:hypothetical protein